MEGDRRSEEQRIQTFFVDIPDGIVEDDVPWLTPRKSDGYGMERSVIHDHLRIVGWENAAGCPSERELP